MEQIFYILFGWLLGLLSPTIIDKISAQYTKKQYFKAVCAELNDLQYRVAIVCFLLGQRYGKIDKEFLLWIQPIIKDYKGNEPNESVALLINSMLTMEEIEFNNMIKHMRAEPNFGLGLKTFTASFLESNIGLISKLPLDLQSKIHEFRNHLNTLNQEIVTATESFKMTFDSSISDDNHKRLTDDLLIKYAHIQGMCQRVVIKLEAVQSSKV
jgi:hypothetical protein